MREQGERLGELFDCSNTYAVRRSGQHLRAIKVLAGLVEQVSSTFNLNAVLFQFKIVDPPLPLCVNSVQLSGFDSNDY